MATVRLHTAGSDDTRLRTEVGHLPEQPLIDRDTSPFITGVEPARNVTLDSRRQCSLSVHCKFRLGYTRRKYRRISWGARFLRSVLLEVRAWRTTISL